MRLSGPSRAPPPDVIYWDNHLLAVNKAACRPSVPDSSGDLSVFEQAELAVKERYNKPGRAWLANAHRLDRPVSGVLLFARTSKAASRLSAAFAAPGQVQKVYWAVAPALALGALGGAAARGRGSGGTVRQWLSKNRATNTVRPVRAGSRGAKEALTDWRVLQRETPHPLLEFRPLTGRPHQLRLAAAELGAPLLGDLRYGGTSPLPDRSIALHARSLEFPHPTRPQRLRLIAPPPPELELEHGETVWGGPLCAQARADGIQVHWTVRRRRISKPKPACSGKLINSRARIGPSDMKETSGPLPRTAHASAGLASLAGPADRALRGLRALRAASPCCGTPGWVVRSAASRGRPIERLHI